tara:strand:- start:527 stop:706 length:180 start_codon:yes stop_codon:yes gene_type:complete
MVLTRSMIKELEDEYTFEEYNKENLRKTINKLNPEYNPYYPFYILISLAITGLYLKYVF